MIESYAYVVLGFIIALLGVVLWLKGDRLSSGSIVLISALVVLIVFVVAFALR